MSDRVLILPQLKVCCSSHHMDFGGTLTIRHATLLAYVCDVLQSALAQGFRTVVLFNSHGGNEAIGRVTIAKPAHSHPEAPVGILTWWPAARDAPPALPESGSGGLGKACHVLNDRRRA